MKHLSALLLFILCRISALNAQECPSFLCGYWSGILEFQGSSLILTLEVQCGAENTYSGFITSPLQSPDSIRVTSLTCRGDSVFVATKKPPMRFNAQISEADSILRGIFQQAVFKIPFEMRKSTEPFSLKRPQEPKPPFPYLSEEVVISNEKDSIKLSGTLTCPDGSGPFPGLVLISGSGPQDRNEEIFGHKPFFVIADYLTRRGIAVLRYDDRGTGKSKGHFATATTMDFAHDAQACLDFLRKDKRIAPDKAGLIGHSEGGMVAAILGAGSTPPDFIIMLAGPALTGEEVLLTQTRKMLDDGTNTPEFIRRIMKDTKKTYAILRKNPNPVKATEKLRHFYKQRSKGLSPDEVLNYGYHKAAVEMKIQAMNAPWFRYFLTFNPEDYLKNVQCPVLALFGSEDVQVLAKENADAFAAISKKHNKTNFSQFTFAGKNHLFQSVSDGGISAYAFTEETIGLDVLDYLNKWIKDFNAGK